MPDAATVPDLTIQRGKLSLELTLRPFSFTLRRVGRRLLRNGSAWVADGTVNDHFIQFTEGVVADEDLAPHERVLRAAVDWQRFGIDSPEHPSEPSQAVALDLWFDGGRRGRMTLALHSDERFVISLAADAEPLRLAIEWDRRSEEHFAGLGARHGSEFDQRGRAVQLGADRRYTGPDCPPEMLAAGGIPQGDCAPVPWMLSSRGYGVLAQTCANGTRFDMSGGAESWWRGQVKGVLEQGVAGIKMDDGDGYYLQDDVRLADGRRGVEAAWELGGLHRVCLQRALDEVHPGEGALFGRSGWIGQHALGHTWAADQASDFWSLRALVVATLAAAASGFSNWSHDVGGYLGHRLVERCPPELLVRWLQFGCFTPLMQAHSRMAHEPWNYGGRMVDTYRAYVLLHEQLVPYVRAAAATAARTGLPIIRPLCLTDPADPRGWELTDAYGYGPSLWVAPVLDDGVREREVELPRGQWIETWSQQRVGGGGEVLAPAPVSQIPVWVRAGAIIVTYPAGHVERGLGDTPASECPLEATLWGAPAGGRASAKLADGLRIDWTESGGWRVSDPGREVSFRVIEA